MPNMMSSRMNKSFACGLLMIGFIFGLAGCKGNSTLESGYQYTPLGASPAARRAFYAGPFSVEARDAQLERSREGQSGNNQVGRYRPGL